MSISFKLNLAILMAASLTCVEATNSSYPVSKPNSEGYMQVSEKHQIYYAEYGNPDGLPIVILHGGPGVGTSDEYTRFFDLTRWHVVMFDQRGAMRSKPFASMEDNTPQNSISDIEVLRKHLGIEQWFVFGNSWGTCLALLYGETHPQSCLGFILTGIFLGREEDIRVFSEESIISQAAYKEFLNSFSLEEQKDIPNACYKRLMDSNPEVHMKMARALMRYQVLNSITPPSQEVLDQVLTNDRLLLSFTRALVYYSMNHCFLSPNQVLSNLGNITHLPAILVHGSLDTVCLPHQARLLHQNWPNSRLMIVEGAGHSSRDPLNMKTLVLATDAFLQSAQN